MNLTAQHILKTIDTSKMERTYGDFHDMCESEFQIYEYLQQSEEPRLTHCYYYTWMCTDTYVGIRVWYFDNEPVCISYKPYRKYDELFYWISQDLFKTVFNYAMHLKEKETPPDFSSIEDMDENILRFAEGIDHKQFESYNKKIDIHQRIKDSGAENMLTMRTAKSVRDMEAFAIHNVKDLDKFKLEAHFPKDKQECNVSLTFDEPMPKAFKILQDYVDHPRGKSFDGATKEEVDEFDLVFMFHAVASAAEDTIDINDYGIAFTIKNI